MGCGASADERRNRHGDYADDEVAVKSPRLIRMYNDLGRRSQCSECDSADEPSDISRSISMAFLSFRARLNDKDDDALNGPDRGSSKELSPSFLTRMHVWLAEIPESPLPIPVVEPSSESQLHVGDDSIMTDRMSNCSRLSFAVSTHMGSEDGSSMQTHTTTGRRSRNRSQNGSASTPCLTPGQASASNMMGSLGDGTPRYATASPSTSRLNEGSQPDITVQAMISTDL